MKKSSSPLMIFCFDAGDVDLINQWVQEGYLPTINRIINQGCWRTIEGTTQHAYDEPGSWLSLLSGVPASEHGYYYFRQFRPDNYKLYLTNWIDGKALGFWSQLRGTDSKVTIIDPPEGRLIDGLSGIQLVDWASHQTEFLILAPSSQPESLLKEIRSQFGLPKRIKEFKLNSSVSEDYLVYQQLLARVRKKGEMCRYLLRSFSDLMLIGFCESHVAAHRFWKYFKKTEINRENDQECELTNAIRNVYAEIDRQLGLLIAQLPKDTNIFVVSAYGVKSQYPTTGLMETFCRQLGYQANESNSTSFTPLALSRKIIPQPWRAKISTYLPGNVQQQLYMDLFHNSTDWSKTTVFPIPSVYTSFLRVNLQGREPLGIVRPGKEYYQLLNRLEADLRELIDLRTGKPAVEKTLRTVDIFNCDLMTNLPDLVVEWKDASHFVDRVYHPKTQLVQQPPAYNRDNYHSLKGFVAATGPDITAKGVDGNISILDLSPTFLSLLGTQIPNKLLGKPVEEFCRNVY